MKKIIKKFWGVAIVVLLMSSLFVVSLPASAVGCFPYSPLPTATAGSPMGITAIGTTVYDYAVAQTNANIIWAATSDNALMSTDQGRTWKKMFIGTQTGDNPTKLVCIAPDDSNIVLYVTDQYPTADQARTVLITMNGGLNWFDLGTPESLAGTDVTRIYDFDISQEFTDQFGFTYRYIGIAGTNGTGATFYYTKFGAYTVSQWREAIDDPTIAEPQGYVNTTADAAFIAVKFSPHFSIDNIAYLMSTNGTAVDMHVISLNIEHRFNTKVSGYNLFGYSDDGVAVTTVVGGVAKAQLLFAADFNGVFYDPSYPRTAYWSVAGCTSGGGYGSFYEDIDGVPGSHAVDHVASWSIALNGTTLVAGRAYTNQTPGGGAPGLTMKRIGGGSVSFGGIDDPYAMLTVFYAGTNLLCAGQGDQSAFSLSLDNGRTWNDISLVDTEMDYIDDFAVEENGVYRYIVSHGPSHGVHQVPCIDETASKADDYAASVWYFDGTYWERVYVRASLSSPATEELGLPSDAHRFQIKASPDNFGVAYLADTANATIYYTPDYGMGSWRQRSAPIVNTQLVDLEIVDDADLYVATNVAGTGYVCPLTFSGQYWNSSDYITVFGAGTTIFSITLVSDDVVVAGSATGGKVSYTTTGGNTPPEWTMITPAVPGVGGILTEALDLGPGGLLIYATPTAPGYSTVWMYLAASYMWVPVGATCLTAPTAYSVDIFIYGTGSAASLYLLSGNSSLSTATLGLQRMYLDGTGWCTLVCTCADWAGRTPDALKGSGPLTTLWFTDRWGDTIWPNPMRGFGETVGRYDQIEVYTDTQAYCTPVITGPADGYVIQVNKQTGVAYDITLTWTGCGPTAMVQVAKDADFTDIKAHGCTTSPVNIGPHAVNTDFIVNWQPGETYWIRVGPCDYCFHWSAAISVTVMSTPLPIAEVYAPACGSTVETLTPGFSWSPMSGATAYTIQVGTGPDLANPAYLMGSWQVTGTTGFEMPVGYLLDGSTYYWRVSAGTAGTNWSPTCSFTVHLPTEPPTVTTTSYIAPSTQTVPVPTDAEDVTVTQTSQAYIWAIIIIGAVLVVAIIVLIFRTRR